MLFRESCKKQIQQKNHETGFARRVFQFSLRQFLKGLLLLSPLFLFARESFQEPWGRDAGLKAPPTEQTTPVTPGIATRIADSIIRFHQEVLSPVDGPRSHFRPTSSRYMQLAMQRYGFFKGFIMGCDRLLRENDEEWVYRTIEIDGKTYKYDPAWVDKYHTIPR